MTRLTLVSPYEPWLTDTSRRFWEEAGLAVDRVVLVPAGDRFDPYEVTTEAILQRVREQDVPDETALLCTGTGMPTLAALTELARETDQVLLSSNLASAWWALRTVGPHSGGPGDHPLLERLARGAGTA